MNRGKRMLGLGLALLLILGGLVPAGGAGLHVRAAEGQATGKIGEYIVKWKAGMPAAFRRTVEIVNADEATGTAVVRPLPGTNVADWLKRWETAEGEEYLQPDHRVEVAQAPNDPGYPKQSYLQQIHAEQAWDVVQKAPKITVAVVDTGVDLSHPDLKAQLVAGANLVDPTKPPQDDNGHGTNVAGIIAAVGNNKTGVSGLVWDVRIMPVKALEADGQGDESTLGKGIKYAVDHGAKIVVLSVGLYPYSPYMRDVVQYAENHGVLLVAASGNDGRAVKYPAAFPNVLAVGGVSGQSQVEPESNYGQEIDLVAPFTVYTTAIGGGYMVNQGTSMAAPQVAGVAALAWALHPEFKPYQIRNLLRQTAQDIGQPGWDRYSGYGMVRADRAVTALYREDMYEPDDTEDSAAYLPLNKLASSVFEDGRDTDWYKVSTLYDGTVDLQLTGVQAPVNSIVTVVYNNGSTKSMKAEDGKSIRFDVKKGTTTWLKIVPDDPQFDQPVTYTIMPQFNIYRDPFEDNDLPYKAFQLPPRKQTVVGTFDHENDQDWYAINLVQAGTLRFSVVPDTARMDISLTVQRPGSKPLTIDRGLDGESEVSPTYDVTPGQYLVTIKNVNAQTSYPVTGEYMLNVDYSPKFVDPNEPNDQSYQAVTMTEGTPYSGMFDSADDQDWFSFQLTERRLVHLNISDIPEDRIMAATLYDSAHKQIKINANAPGESKLIMLEPLDAGTYYVRLTSDKKFAYQLYQMTLTTEGLKDGFTDVDGHWAEKSIAYLTKQGWIKGYGDYTFRPEQPITRAEAATVLVQALNLKTPAKTTFRDVPSGYWADKYIRIAKQAGLISGYRDGTFRPDDTITRAEMAAMLAKAMKLKPGVEMTSFADVDSGYWAAAYIHALVNRNVLAGYQDGTFRPEKQATRAEYASLLDRAFHKK